MPMGGIFSLLVQKLVSKSNKNRVFCILCMPIGRPNPPPHMATLLLSAVRIGILPFNSSSIALVSFFIDLRKKKGKMPILAAKSRVSNRTWTRTVNPNEPFHFGEPEPNLNQQNFSSVNLNQTWTLKIVLKWTITELEPLKKVRIYFSISGGRWRWYTHNKSSGDHQQDQQFFLFFSGRKE